MAILDNLTDQIYAFQIFKLLAFKLYSAKLLKNSKKNGVIHTAPKNKVVHTTHSLYFKSFKAFKSQQNASHLNGSQRDPMRFSI